MSSLPKSTATELLEPLPYAGLRTTFLKETKRDGVRALLADVSVKEARVGTKGRVRSTLRLLVPMLLVVVPIAGLASVLLGWLLLHRVTKPLDAPMDNSFLVDEGTRMEGGLQSARLTGLTISALAVSKASCT
jgi:hypothetical protein